MMIETVRARLTLWYVSTLAAALIVVGGLIYGLLARALYVRIDENLAAVTRIAMTSLQNDLGEGQDAADAARSTAAELASSQQMLVIFDGDGRLLAEEGRDDDVEFVLPPLDRIPQEEPALLTIEEPRDRSDRHRLALRRVTIPPAGVKYVVVVGSPLERTDEELESLREIIWYVGPLALVLAGIGGWFLAKHSLAPVVAMGERARQIGVGNLGERLPVGNRRDELGRLAQTFNELLGRLEASLVQQRQFMADASHELRTPVATARTAAGVALQQATRSEAEYREALAIIEQQTARLSRLVEDMFTLARADAGNYPVRRVPMYLDEVIDEVARAAQVLADRRQVTVETAGERSAALVADEDLVRRLLVNLVDNAVRHTPAHSAVRITLERADGGYRITVTDRGPGIPARVQPHIFERFYRGDTARAREQPYEGAGLGLSLARWIARAHGGDVTLATSSADGTTFLVFLPSSSIHPPVATVVPGDS